MQLTDYLEQQIKIPNELLLSLDGLFEKLEFKKNDFLLKQGEISNKIFFIESGVVREYSIGESESEKVITYWILPENEWIYQIESFELETASYSNIRAETQVQARSISKVLFEQLINKSADFSPYVLKIYRKYLLQLEFRNRMHQLRKVEDRLTYFDQKHPGLSQKIPLYIIASYLNTTATNLSRVRNKAFFGSKT